MGIWHNVRIEVEGTEGDALLQEACESVGDLQDVFVRKNKHGLVAEAEATKLTKPLELIKPIIEEVKKRFKGREVKVRLYDRSVRLMAGLKADRNGNVDLHEV